MIVPNMKTIDLLVLLLSRQRQRVGPGLRSLGQVFHPLLYHAMDREYKASSGFRRTVPGGYHLFAGYVQGVAVVLCEDGLGPDREEDEEAGASPTAMESAEATGATGATSTVEAAPPQAAPHQVPAVPQKSLSAVSEVAKPPFPGIQLATSQRRMEKGA
jgi:hypothetical protein